MRDRKLLLVDTRVKKVHQMKKNINWIVKMMGMKSTCFGLVSIILIVILHAACSSGNEKENKDYASSILDTLNYDKQSYDSMRAYFSADTVFVTALNSRIEAGDADAGKMKRLLTTEYESRDHAGLTESEIKTTMVYYYAYHASRRAIEEFKEIESRFPKSDAVRKKTDSMVNKIEELKKKIKELSEP